ALAQALGVVGPSDALGGRVAQQPLDRRVREFGTVARAVSGFVEQARNGLFSVVLREELVQELSHGCLFGVGGECAIFPSVSEGGGTPERLAELCANGDGGCNSLRDFFPFPLGHGGNHG